MRPRAILGWTPVGLALVAFATYIAVFVLPYRFPLHHPVLSDTWTAGANNQVAAIGIAIVSVLATFTCWQWHDPAKPRPASQPSQLSSRYLFAGILAAIAWTAVLGTAVTRAHIYWGDEGYFLNQLRTGLVFHQPLYRGFEFAYGPALYLWPAAFIRCLAALDISNPAAYLISLAAMQALGLFLLFYVVQALPLRHSLKVAAFILITFGTLTSLLGLNYSLFRFILPLAAVVLLSRQPTVRHAAFFAFLAEVVALSISPELGIAFAAAAIAYSIYRAASEARLWLLVSTTPLLAATLFATAVGPTYLLTLGKMAQGGFNLLLSPAPHVLAYLFALVVLCPLAISRQLRHSSDTFAHKGMILGLYAVSLALIPAALGRCDPIHVFFNGIGVYLLSFLAIDQLPRPRRSLWIVTVALIFLLTQARNLRLYQYRLQIIFGLARLNALENVDEQNLLQAIGHQKISAPILAPLPILEDLTRRGQYVPGFYCGWVGVWDHQAEARVITDIRRTPYALVAYTDPPEPNPTADRQLAFLMRLGFAHHPTNPVYVRGALLQQELDTHWILVGPFGDYALYRQNM